MIKMSKLFNLITNKKGYFFAIIILWLSFEYLFLGPLSFIKINDAGDGTIPRYMNTATSLHEHGRSQWLHNNIGGHDRISNGISALNIPNALYLILPGWLAYQISIVLSLIFSLYFTFRLCRDQLQLSDISSIFGGVAYAACLLMYDTVFYYFSYASLPFVLWALERIISMKSTSKKLIYLVLLAFFYAMSSTVTNSLPYTLIFLMLWFLFFNEYKMKRVLFVTIFLAITILLKLPDIYRIILLAEDSQRNNFSFSYSDSFPYAIRWINLFIVTYKYFFPIILLGIYVTKLKDRRLLFLIITMVIFSMWPLYEVIKNYIKLPMLLNGLKLYGFLYLASFLCMISTAYSLNVIPEDAYLISDSKKKRVKLVDVLVLIMFVIVLGINLGTKYNHAKVWFRDGNYAYNFQDKSLKEFYQKNQGEIYRVLTINLEPSIISTYGFETIDGYVNMFPKSYENYWKAVTSPYCAKMGKCHTEGQNHIRLRVPDMSEEVVLEDYVNLDLLSLGNVKYIISKVKLRDNGTLSILSSEVSTYYIYENKQYLPRFYFVNNIKIFTDSKSLFEAMSKSDRKSLRNTAYLEKDYSSSITSVDNLNTEATATIDVYTPDKIKLAINSKPLSFSQPGFLILANSYNPFWKCFIDKKEVKILRANGTFWGVFLESMPKEIEFIYSPPQFYERLFAVLG